MNKREKKLKALNMYIKNPHDMMFKEQFAVKENAASLLREVLSFNTLENLDLSSLELKSGSYVDDSLKDVASDLLYEVEFKDETKGFVYFLIEHKSYQDRFTSFQLLGYMVQIWKQYLKDNRQAKALPVIIPCLFYQGKQELVSNYNFKDLFSSGVATSRFIPSFDLALFDAKKYRGEFLEDSLQLHISVFVMKHIFDKNINDKYVEALNLVKNIPADKRAIYLYTLFRYVVNGQKSLAVEELMGITEKNIEGVGVMGITKKFHDEWVQKGVEQGIEQGIEQGRKKGINEEKKNSILLILEIKFGKEALFLKERVLKIKKIEKLDEIILEIKNSSKLDDIVKLF